MRKLLMTLAVSLLLLTGVAASGIQINIDGENISADVMPIIEDGRTLVPLRLIGENLGAEVGWDNASKTILIVKGDVEIKLPPSKIIKGRSLVPLRFISEKLGSQVDWDNSSKTVFIKSEKEPDSKPTVGTIIKTIKYPDFVEEDYYEGEVLVRDGLELVHGKGKLVLKNGTVYEGSFKNGSISGKGKASHANGDVYVGEFKDNLYHGQGKYSYGFGDIVYEGGWKEGMYSGQGKITSPEGPIVEGEFEKDMMNGPGKITYPDGEIHEGNFKDDMMHGPGKITYPDGEVVEAEFDNGFMIVD